MPTKSKLVLSNKQPYHHGDLRAALIAAALSLVDQHGVKGFTLKDAAVLAGVSTAAPYRHFADKEALLQAICQEGFILFNTSLAAAWESAGTSEAAILELGIAYVQFALQHPAHFRLMFSLSGSKQPEAAQSGTTGFDLLVRSVAALHPQATREHQTDVVLASWSLVHGFAILHLEGAFASVGLSGDMEQHLRRALHLFVAQTITPGP